jgi:hypothetical protein
MEDLNLSITQENGPYAMWDKCIKEVEELEKRGVFKYAKDKDGKDKILTPRGKNEEGEFEFSRLSEIYAKVARTSTFLAWFGDWTQADKTNVSKVVYEDTGEPRVVFHGTNKYIPPNEGLKTKGFNNKSGPNIFLTEWLMKAKLFANKIKTSESQIFCGFIKIVKPAFKNNAFQLIISPVTKIENDGVVISNSGRLLSSADYVIFSHESLLQLPSPRNIKGINF